VRSSPIASPPRDDPAYARDYIRATRFREGADDLPELPPQVTVTAAAAVFIATTPL
jgi:hypothetical protein